VGVCRQAIQNIYFGPSRKRAKTDLAWDSVCLFVVVLLRRITEYCACATYPTKGACSRLTCRDFYWIKYLRIPGFPLRKAVPAILQVAARVSVYGARVLAKLGITKTSIQDELRAAQYHSSQLLQIRWHQHPQGRRS
jgi:hypothetical protein